VQDYWYSGGVLYNDNSYPNIYTIGYKGTGTSVASIPSNQNMPNIPSIILPLNIKNETMKPWSNQVYSLPESIISRNLL
jgi:hypothetical protein